jgi:hypothetical protein
MTIFDRIFDHSPAAINTDAFKTTISHVIKLNQTTDPRKILDSNEDINSCMYRRILKPTSQKKKSESLQSEFSVI